MFNDPPGLHIITLFGLFLDAGSGNCARMQHWLLRLDPYMRPSKAPEPLGK